MLCCICCDLLRCCVVIVVLSCALCGVVRVAVLCYDLIVVILCWSMLRPCASDNLNTTILLCYKGIPISLKMGKPKAKTIK